MKTGKANLKSIIVVVIILLVGVLSVVLINTARTYITGAAAGYDPINVSSTLGEDGKSATITWTTEKPAQAVVEYGTNAASMLLRSPESEPTTDHRLVLTPLKQGQNYFFRIKVGEDIYDNGGIPFSFKTKSSGEVTVSPTKAPVVTVVPTVSTQTKPAGCTGVDFDKNGVVNSVDFIKCTQAGGASPMPTSATSTGSAVGNCKSGVDYDGNGTINSVDMIRCLQKAN